MTRNGRAAASVTRDGDTVYVTATCDSLQREAEYYEELYYRARDSLEQHSNDIISKAETSKDNSRRNFYILLILMPALTLGIVIIDIIKNKKWQKK